MAEEAKRNIVVKLQKMAPDMYNKVIGFWQYALVSISLYLQRLIPLHSFKANLIFFLFTY